MAKLCVTGVATAGLCAAVRSLSELFPATLAPPAASVLAGTMGTMAGVALLWVIIWGVWCVIRGD